MRKPNSINVLIICDLIYPDASRLAALFLPVYAFACSKPISTYSIYVSASILAIYLLFIKMLILNLWLTIFQMVILIFLKVMTMEVCGFTCGFVKNSIGRVSWSCVFCK